MGILLRRKVGDSQRTLDLSGWSSDITVQRTMTGTSTLTITVSDPEWLTATSGYFDLDQDGKFSNIWIMWYGNQYSLVQMTPNDEETVLTFEDAAIHELKQQFGHKTRKRKDGFTRAMFIQLLIDEANANTQNDQVFIKFYAPDLNKDKRIAKPDIPDTTTNQSDQNSDIQFKNGKNNPGDKGISKHERRALLRKWNNNKAGAPLSNYRLDIAERVLKICDDHNAKEITKISMIFAAWAESKLSPNTAPNKGGYEGLFGWRYGHGNARRYVERPAKYWLIGGYGFQGGGGIQVTRDYPRAEVREIAQRVEGIWNPALNHGQYEIENGFSYFVPLAQDIVTAYDGGGVDNSGGVKNRGNIKQTYKEKAYHFERNKGESSWACIKRLANEVNWAVWCEGQTVHFMTEEDIYLQNPRRTVNRDSSHKLTFEFDWDEGKYISTCKTTFLSDHWKVPPGHNVDVIGAGPADGRWLIEDVTREGEQDDTAPPGGIVTVTLQTVSAPRLEPAPDVTSGSKDGKKKKNSDIVFKKGAKTTQKIVEVAKLAHSRAPLHYTEGTRRWDAVEHPKTWHFADCSSFATSCFKGANLKDPNHTHYVSGYTGTLSLYGRRVTQPQPGDLVFYGAAWPWVHVAVFIGNGNVISHGQEGGPHLLPWNYRGDVGQIRRYV